MEEHVIPMEESLLTKVETTNVGETSGDDEKVNTAIAGMKEHVIPMEQSLWTKVKTTYAGETSGIDKESPSTKVERTNNGEISRGHDQSVDHTKAIENQSVTINEEIKLTADGVSKALTYLRSKLAKVDRPINIDKPWDVDKNMPRHVPCPKVPKILRNEERSKEYYDPKVVSFGPYHHGKPELQAVERIKTMVMQEFICRHRESIEDFEDLYIQVFKLNQYAKSCYVDGSTAAYDDDTFALMMLRDGCFILALFENDARELIVSKYLDIFQRSYSLRDTILLENQIPFRVLNVLMRNIYGEEDRGLEMVTSFLRNMHWGNILEQDTPDKAKEPDHLLGLQFTLISKCDCPGEINPQDFTSFFPSFGSVSDLQAVGINFKASNSISLHSAKKEIPKSISLRDVKFRPGFFTGELILPPLLLTPDALVYYNNLIAFEMCATYIDATITSYISFMNSLIANPEDVKVLRSKHIILHTLNSDEEVFKMLKEVGTKWMPVDAFIYQSVRKIFKSTITARYGSG